MIISELVVSMDVVEVKCAVKSVAGRNDSRVKQNRASLSVRTYSNLENWAKVLTISQSGQPHLSNTCNLQAWGPGFVLKLGRNLGIERKNTSLLLSQAMRNKNVSRTVYNSDHERK